MLQIRPPPPYPCEPVNARARRRSMGLMHTNGSRDHKGGGRGGGGGGDEEEEGGSFFRCRLSILSQCAAARLRELAAFLLRYYQPHYTSRSVVCLLANGFCAAEENGAHRATSAGQWDHRMNKLQLQSPPPMGSRPPQEVALCAHFSSAV